MYLGSFGIDDYVGIPAATHRFSSGAAYAPSAITYSIYEEATDVGLDEDVDMVPASPFDSIVGCYWVRRQLTTAAGFEAGKNYLVVVKATVDSVAAIEMHTFQVQAAVATATALAAVDGKLDTIDGIVDAILEDTGTTLQGELDGIQADTEDLQTQIGAAGAGLTAILNRLISLALTTGVVVADGGNTASSFMTDLAGADNFWNDCLILITSGALAGQVKEIGDFADADGVVTLTSGQAFTDTPAGDVTFVIINR